MRIAVVGATGNVGTSVLRALGRDPDIEAIRGIARRLPHAAFAKTEFFSADVASDPLISLFEGMDAVIHLGWRIQSSHEPHVLERSNVYGSQRVFQAVAGAHVPVLVYASSIGAYSKGPKHRLVDESWPTDGIPTSLYSTQKARVERLLDTFEARHPHVRCVRMRPALIFKGEAGSEIRRLFLAPWFPRWLFSPSLIKLVPYNPRLHLQNVHSFDVGEAFRLAVKRDVRGAFNLATSPVLDSAVLAQAFKARQIPVSQALMRKLADLTWRLRLQRTDSGWIDLALDSPLVSSVRAEELLGWKPQHTSLETLRELLQGMRDGAGIATPPLSPARLIRAVSRSDRAGTATDMTICPE